MDLGGLRSTKWQLVTAMSHGNHKLRHSPQARTFKGWNDKSTTSEGVMTLNNFEHNVSRDSGTV